MLALYTPPVIVGEGCGYHPMLITEQLYKHSPRVPLSVSKLHMSSLDLLHHGTGSIDDDASPRGRSGIDAVRKVAQVCNLFNRDKACVFVIFKIKIKLVSL